MAYVREPTGPDGIEQALFDAVWLGLAMGGRCDSLGGAEYRRVWDRYVRAGYPAQVRRFILTWTNQPSSGHRFGGPYRE